MRNCTLIALLATTACTVTATPAEARKAKVTPSFSISCGTVTEEGGSATCRITKTGTNGRASIVSYHTTEGTAGTDDFTAVDGTVTFRNNEQVRDVSALVTDDHETESAETFTWTIAVESNGTVGTGTATTTIAASDQDTQVCDDGTVIPAAETCPVVEEPEPLPENPTPPEPEDPVVVPPPPTTTCPDGSIILATGQCPAPAPTTQTCPDGTVIPFGNQCPVVTDPEPTPTPTPTQTCWDGSIIPTTSTCPVPTTTPPPSIIIDGKVAYEGDSQNVTWPNTTPGGNWTNVDRVNRSSSCSLAIGGSVLGLSTSGTGALNNPTRLAAVDACNPEVVTFAPTGSNDQLTITADEWMRRLWLWTDYHTAKGRKVVIGTPIPQGNAAKTSDPDWGTKSAARVEDLATRMLAQVSLHPGVTVVDLRDVPELQDPTNTSYFQADQLHLNGCSGPEGPQGQCALYRAMAPVVDEALGEEVLPPSSTPTGPNGDTGVTSNFDINLALQTAGIPAHQPLINEVVGAFRFICGPGQLLYDDPVVYPGQTGASHLHQFYGNTAADADSTYANLRAAGGSTCNIVDGAPADGIAANRSAYWMPAMLDGKGHVAMPDFIQVYYKREPDNSLYTDEVSACDPANANKMGVCGPIPNGLKFISGFNMATGTNTHPGWFSCRGTGAANVVWKANVDGLTKANSTTCPVGSQLEMTVASPKCWNGVLDAPDHMSNMMVPVRNASTNWVLKCPTTHPYVIPQFTIGAFFTIRAGDDVGLWQLSSDHMYPSLGRGKTLHFDYFEAWDPAIKQMWTDACIDEYRNGSAGSLCNGRALKGAASGAVATFVSGLNLRPDIPVDPTP